MRIEQIREDTPYCGDKIFLDSAGASLMPRSVVRKIHDYLAEEEQYGGYKVVERREPDIRDFYVHTATLLHCNPENIAFAHDATDAYAKALSSIDFHPDDVIITTDDDYASNHIQFISLQARYHIRVIRVRNLENGDLDIGDFESLVLQHHPKLVAVTHVPTNSGLVQNVQAIGEICQKHQILYLVDACQSLGQIPVDVQKIQCDFLTATGRKFLRGPRGTGLLFVSDRVLQEGYAPLYVDGNGATWIAPDRIEIVDGAKRFEMWEAPYALLVGLSEAMRYASAIGIEHIQAYNQELMTRLRGNLSGLPGVQVFDRGSETCNILTLRKADRSLERIKTELDKHQVFYSINRKEWGLIDFHKKGVDWVVRLSPHYFNTIEEIDKVCEIIEEV